MTPNPAYIRALRDSVKQAPYPNLIGMTIASIEFDRCRIETPELQEVASGQQAACHLYPQHSALPPLPPMTRSHLETRP